MTTQLSPRQFAEAIGVSESSVRRWADDGRIRMTRTGGGHRKIARSEAIRFIRETSAQVVRPDLLEIREPGDRHQRPAAFSAQHDELYEALRIGDREVVFGLLTRMYVNGVSAANICDGPLRSAMHEIGALWPDDKNAILIEHRATTICVDALNRLRGDFSTPQPTRMVAIGGALENDPYILPSMMVTTVLAEIGFNAVNLGPNTPYDVIRQLARQQNPKLIWLSLTTRHAKERINTMLQEITKQLSRTKTHLVIGGKTASLYRVPEGKYVHSFSTLSEMSGFAKTLVNESPRSSRNSR